VRASLESIVDQTDDRFEIMVVDNFSNNGSELVLEEFAGRGRLRLCKAKSNRGMARQIAFALSTGEHVISGMDLDDTFEPNLKDFVGVYLANYQGKVLRVRRSPKGDSVFTTSITVASRRVLSNLGGWRDLQWFEDVDLWERATDAQEFSEITYPLLKTRSNHPERRGLVGKARYRYIADRDRMRIGYPAVFSIKKGPLYAASWLSAKMLGEPRSLDPQRLSEAYLSKSV